MTATFIVVGGPAGTGKTSLADLLSKYYNCPYIEGDTLHPQANIDKMSKGIALTDEDRWDWLKELSMTTVENCFQKGNDKKMAIVSCSMLKKSYREFIKKNASEASEEPVTFRFLFLSATFEELITRVTNRKNHYMKSDMVKSQYDIMEKPHGKELICNGGSCLTIETTNRSIPDIFQFVLKEIRLDI